MIDHFITCSIIQKLESKEPNTKISTDIFHSFLTWKHGLAESLYAELLIEILAISGYFCLFLKISVYRTFKNHFW